MATASTSVLPPELAVTVSYAGTATTFAFDAATSHLSDLHAAVASAFSVPPSAQKLIVKGKRLPADPATPLATVVRPQAKVLLVGVPQAELEEMRLAQEVRQRKQDAFQYHRQHKAPPVRNTTTATLDENDQFKFHQIVPFPPDVPSLDARKKMLDRLANDPAVRDVMIRHKFVVGTLTELHPLLQPDLLGLNKNAGQEICVRLLTDSLEGTRPYLEVRRVLIHELTHNEFGPHDDKFKTLNSLLTKEVAAYETARGLRVGQAAVEPWEPEGDDAVERTAHRLDEVDVGPSARHLLRLSAEDELDERRERMRAAAEERQRRGEKAKVGETPPAGGNPSRS